ncbi:MAG: glucose-1-phosphate thymidylyltransferase [bacterium]|nr:glucose-1-phosphate thymidylyltransferase [bacterium]
MKGLILSGGKGTRLYPLTYTRAKQLIPVANKPVLFRVIEAIRDAGVNEIGVIVGDTAPEIEDALNNRPELGVSITYIHQKSPDGLAHAVKIAQDFIGDERFVMFLGDNVIQGGIGDLIRDFAANDWNSQIVLKKVKDPVGLGVAVLQPDGGIERLVEKAPIPPSDLALVGIYMFDHHIFEAVNSIQPSARGEYEITDAIQWLIDHGYQVYPHVHQGWWIDTGKPFDMLDANGYVLEELTPTLSPEAFIDEASQVDGRVTVERGARIINSIVRGPTIIGEDTIIENSYIGPYTSIYHHVMARNCEIERSIVLENSKIIDLDSRLQDSLIGRYAKVTRNERKPSALKMNLGDYSTVWID